MDLISWILSLFQTKKPLPVIAQESTPKGLVKTVKINRNDKTDKAIRGVLTIDGVTHDPIYTLENPERDTKTDSCIPAGKYTCKPYSGTKYRDVYILENVPGRTAILIHWGNTEKDTLGCLLIGNQLGTLNGEPAVLESKICYERFRKLIGKESFELEIT